jgi:hypothetical protein
MALSKQLLALHDPENNTLFSSFWRRFTNYVLDDTIEYKRDNSVFLLTELSLNLLRAQDVEPRTQAANQIASEILATVVLLAHNKRPDFLLEITCFIPNPLQEYWGIGMEPEEPVRLVMELLFLQARHYPNTEEFGTPMVCDNGYNRILHRVLSKILDLLYNITNIPLAKLAVRYMAPCEYD